MSVVVDRPRVNPTKLRSAIVREWERVHPERSMQRNQQPGMTAFGLWYGQLVLLEQSGAIDKDVTRLEDGRMWVRRSIPQIRAGVEREQVAMGDAYGGTIWRSKGGAKADSRRYVVQIHRQIDYFTRIGWLDGHETIREPNGEATGIAILLTPAGVAQSVKATPPRPKAPPRALAPPGAQPDLTADERGPGPAESSGQMLGPSGLPQRSGATSILSGPPRDRCAGARSLAEAQRDATEELASRRRGAALDALRSRAASGGSASLAALREAVREGNVDPLAVAIVAWEVVHGADTHPWLSRQRRRDLVHACSIWDRHAPGGPAPGYALEQLLDFMADSWQYAEERIASLGFYASWLLHKAHQARRVAKGLPAYTTKAIVQDDGTVKQLRSDWWWDRWDRLDPERARQVEQRWRSKHPRRGGTA